MPVSHQTEIEIGIFKLKFSKKKKITNLLASKSNTTDEGCYLSGSSSSTAAMSSHASQLLGSSADTGNLVSVVKVTTNSPLQEATKTNTALFFINNVNGMQQHT
jgi:hypothetical protein